MLSPKSHHSQSLYLCFEEKNIPKENKSVSPHTQYTMGNTSKIVLLWAYKQAAFLSRSRQSFGSGPGAWVRALAPHGVRTGPGDAVLDTTFVLSFFLERINSRIPRETPLRELSNSNHLS